LVSTVGCFAKIFGISYYPFHNEIIVVMMAIENGHLKGWNLLWIKTNTYCCVEGIANFLGFSSVTRLSLVDTIPVNIMFWFSGICIDSGRNRFDFPKYI
jgi:hypothetical protein